MPDKMKKLFDLRPWSTPDATIEFAGPLKTFTLVYRMEQSGSRGVYAD